MATKATIWNPNDPNSKKAVDVGAPMEKGYQLWTGGNASGQQAADAIKKAAATTPGQPGALGNIATTPLPKLTDLNKGRDNTNAAAAVAAGGYDQSLVNNGQVPGSPSPTPTTDFSTLLKGIGTVTADPSITTSTNAANQYAIDEKARLSASKDSALASLDTAFAANLAKLKASNANQTAATKARLIKLGMSPSDSSFDNTVQGQLDRNSAAEDALTSEYNSNKIKVMSDMEDKISNVTFNQIKTANDNAIASANNLLQKQGLAKDILSIFNARDQAIKDRETQAYNDLLTYNAKMATLEQADKEALATTFMSNAKSGMYNISDPDTFRMLSDMEKQYPNYLAGLTDIATTGLKERVTDMAQKEATLAKTEAETARTKKLTANSGSGSGSTNSIKFDASTKNALSLQGYSSGEIAQMEKDSSEYGLKSVMDGLSPESQKILSKLGGQEDVMDETSVGLYISSATDKDGNLDVTKIPAAEREAVLGRAKDLGYFDETDADTGNWLSRQWSDLKSVVNPFD